MVKRKKSKKRQSYRERSKSISKERRLRQKLARIWRYGFVITLVILIILGSWLENSGRIAGFRQYVSDSFIGLTSYMGMNLEVIYHYGLDRVSEEELQSYLPLYKVPIYSFSLDELKIQLESLGWIKQVDIERQLPNELAITIVEREPQAIWQFDGKLKLIDREGEIITQENIEEFARLPIIVGEDANSFFESLYIFMSEDADLMAQVTSIIRIGGRRWNVRLKNGIEIKLPENAPDVAWRKLAKLQREKHILDREIKTIDLRVEDRLFIQPIAQK